MSHPVDKTWTEVKKNKHILFLFIYFSKSRPAFFNRFTGNASWLSAHLYPTAYSWCHFYYVFDPQMSHKCTKCSNRTRAEKSSWTQIVGLQKIKFVLRLLGSWIMFKSQQDNNETDISCDECLLSNICYKDNWQYMNKWQDEKKKIRRYKY